MGLEKQNFVIIASSFAPQNRISAIRMSKISKYLTRLGHNVTVLTPELEKNDPIDNSLLSTEFDQMNVIRVKHGRIFKSTLKALRNRMLKEKTSFSYMTGSETFFSKMKSRIFKLGIEYYLHLESKLWEKEVKKHFKKNESYKDYILISSYPKLSTHSVALKLKKEKKVKKWVADFRDPLVYEELNTRAHVKKAKKIQKDISENADIVTYVSKDMITKLTTTNQDRSKFYYLPNGYDKEDLSAITVSSVDIEEKYNEYLKFAYVGGLYGGKRNLNKLFNVISMLIKSNIISENKVKFFYAGKEFNVLKDQARSYNLENILVNMGLVTRESSLAIQKQSDIIVVSTWNTKADVGVIPAKIYECFLLRKPVITVTSGTKSNSELGKMVLKSKLGLELNDMLDDTAEDKQVMSFIQEINENRNSFYNKTINEEYIEQFDYSTLTDKLIELTKVNR